MVDLARVRIPWTGPAVIGPAVSTFYTQGTGAALCSALSAFFSSAQSAFPNGKVTWQFPSGGEVIDSASGHLVGAWSGGPGISLTAASTDATWVSGVGARIVWNTGAVVNGRRVRGSTFMVPLKGLAYDSDGTIGSTFVSSLQAAATALVTAVPSLTVWSRPPAGAPTGGGASPVTSAQMVDAVSWLRSRRT